MAELKVGGLALVFGLRKNPQANGKCVRLLMKVSPREVFKSPVSNKTLIHGEKTPSWICEGDIKHTHLKENGWASFDHKNLMPIDGDDFQHEDEQLKELTYG